MLSNFMPGPSPSNPLRRGAMPGALALTLALAAAWPCAAQTPRQEAKSVDASVTFPTRFLLYLPEGYAQGDDRWPLLIFLHGMGERGTDIEQLKLHGPPRLIAEGKDFPFIVASPQCPPDSFWDAERLDAWLETLLRDYRIDPERIYLTGLSMGGFGTWAWAARRPDRFAAIAPICGGGDPRTAEQIQHIPAWVFHGGKDTVVPLARSQQMVDALKELGADVQLTIYPDAGHDSWTQTYADPKLYEWMLEHKR